MDPLSVATSIAGLIVAACQVSSFLKDSVVGYLGRPKTDCGADPKMDCGFAYCS